MSGPKVSVYELSPQQRQNLRAQMNCVQQSFARYEQVKPIISHLNSLGGQIQSLLNTLSLINKRTGDCSTEINDLSGMQNSLVQDCSSFMNEILVNKPVLEGKIILSNEALNEKKARLAQLGSIQSKVIAYQKNIEQLLHKIDAKAKGGMVEVESGIAADIASVSSFYVESDKTDGEKLSASKKSFEEQLRTLSVSDDCPADIKMEMSNALITLYRLTDAQHLETFSSVTLKPLLLKYEDLLAKQREQIDIFNELQSRYISLCIVAKMQAKAFTIEDTGIESLNAEIAILEKRIVMQTEQEYISDCVNDVMSEMGYDLIGNRSVTKRSGKRFKNELFSYGDGTAINVTYDADGQIAMELGGIDRVDRIPTSHETAALCEEMETFCTDFKVFEEKLQAKGVSIRSRVSLAPPATEYATIINAEDYNITTTKPVTEISVKSKRKKSVSQQVLRKEDN